MLEQIAKGRYLVIGRAGMDFYADPPGEKIADSTGFKAALGGSSANIAVALSQYGLSADLVTSLSDDAVGWYCSNQLEAYGVGLGYVRLLQGEMRTSLAVVETRLTDCQSVIYRNNASDFHMDEGDIAAIDFEPYGALVITGTVFAEEPSRSAGLLALERARATAKATILDLDYRPYSWPSPEIAKETYARAAALCDIVIGNDDEFAVLAGGYRDGEGCAKQLVENSAQIAVYKMGRQGSRTFVNGAPPISTGIFAVDALKPTGAGDAFMGGFIASLAAGKTVETAVQNGSAAAAIVVTKVGCAPAMPDWQTLDAFIRNHPGMSKPAA